MCTGLNYVDISKRELSSVDQWNQVETNFGSYLIVVAVKGSKSDQLSLTMEGHSRISKQPPKLQKFEQKDLRNLVNFEVSNQFRNLTFSITQALDVYANEVQQRDLAYFTDFHETNQIVGMFGKYFLALDWDYQDEKLYGFESFKDKDHRDTAVTMGYEIDVISSLPDNSQIMLYQARNRKIFTLQRTKVANDFTRVFETKSELRLQNRPSLQLGEQDSVV